MGLALAIVFLWLAGLALWIAFHNLTTLQAETMTLPGVLGAIIAYVKGGEKPTGKSETPGSTPPETAPPGTWMGSLPTSAGASSSGGGGVVDTFNPPPDVVQV